MGIPMKYGRCQGGPFNAKDMAHPEPVYRVALDQLMRKTYPGMQSSSDPDIKFGEYHFEGKVWIWRG